MDLSINLLDIRYRLYLRNFFPPDLGGFENRFGHGMRRRLSTVTSQLLPTDDHQIGYKLGTNINIIRSRATIFACYQILIKTPESYSTKNDF